MCELLAMFVVVGAYERNNNYVYFEIKNSGVVEQFIVPVEQYKKCFKRVTPEISV